MANQEEAIEHSIDQLIALNMDDSDKVELTHRPANNVALTDAERREKTLLDRPTTATRTT